MFRQKLCRILVTGALLSLGACSGFDEESAALQVRERFCEGWPYGCSDRTRVEIEKVRETNRGRTVEFRVIDREDRTARLSSAYFEEEEDRWSLLFFESPFKEVFEAAAAHVEEEKRRFSDELREIKAKQNWFQTIYSRYATSVGQLDSVSYHPPDFPIVLDASGDAWKAEIVGEQVRCELDAARHQLPQCSGLSAEDAGTESGPLSRVFGEGTLARTN